MFDEYTSQRNSYREIAAGIVTAVVLAAIIFGTLFYLFAGLAINGYEDFPVIGLFDIHEKPQYRWLENLAWAAFMACYAYGLSQLIYIIPAFYLARAKGYNNFAKGLMIGAALILLLQSACFGAMFMAVRLK